MYQYSCMNAISEVGLQKFTDKYVKTENVGNKAAYTKTRVSCAILMVFGIITLVINFLF